MYAVIFELEPAPEKLSNYLQMDQSLKDELARIEGFISVERFESLSCPGRYLSLSFWRDEKSLTVWRNLASHRYAQQLGRDALFTDYRLRVAKVARDYGLHEREHAPTDSQRWHSRERP